MLKKLLLIIRSAAIVLLSLFYCCAPSLLLPTTQDAQRAKVLWSDMDSTKLQAGHRLYINKCGKCHYLYRPSRFSEEHWLKKLPDMKKEAKLDNEQLDLITKYILTMREASAPVKPNGKSKHS